MTTLPFNAAGTQATGISPDPNNASRAFLSISGFQGVYRHRARFRDRNFGASWTETDTGLPDIPVLRILVDRTNVTGNTVYAGTDIGMFKSTNGGTSWTAFNLGVLPAAAVFDVEQNNNGVVFIGTHGRGAYQLSSASTATPTPTPIKTPTPKPTATHTATAKPTAYAYADERDRSDSDPHTAAPRRRWSGHPHPNRLGRRRRPRRPRCRRPSC